MKKLLLFLILPYFLIGCYTSFQIVEDSPQRAVIVIPTPTTHYYYNPPLYYYYGRPIIYRNYHRTTIIHTHNSTVKQPIVNNRRGGVRNIPRGTSTTLTNRGTNRSEVGSSSTNSRKRVRN